MQERAGRQALTSHPVNPESPQQETKPPQEASPTLLAPTLAPHLLSVTLNCAQGAQDDLIAGKRRPTSSLGLPSSLTVISFITAAFSAPRSLSYFSSLPPQGWSRG